MKVMAIWKGVGPGVRGPVGMLRVVVEAGIRMLDMPGFKSGSGKGQENGPVSRRKRQLSCKLKCTGLGASGSASPVHAGESQ